VQCISVASINTGEAYAKCAMCGKTTVTSNEQDNNKETNQQQEVIVEQIDGTSYTFDTADCAMMFKRFSAVYGSSFADE
jgi:hypothetical protein